MGSRVVALRTLLVASLAIAAPGSLQAAPLTGNFNITGFAAVGPVSVDFFGGPPGCGVPTLGAPGCFLANVPLTGDFATLVPGAVAGSIKDLQGPPISGNILDPLFMTLINGISFDLTRVVPGGAPDCAVVNGNAPNVSCTPVILGELSPYVLTNNFIGSNATVSFNIEANGYLGTSVTGSSQYLGAFYSPSEGKNIAGILNDFAGNTPLTVEYSASFAAGSAPPPPPSVPEPATVTLLGTGLLAILLRARRHRRSV